VGFLFFCFFGGEKGQEVEVEVSKKRTKTEGGRERKAVARDKVDKSDHHRPPLQHLELAGSAFCLQRWMQRRRFYPSAGREERGEERRELNHGRRKMRCNDGGGGERRRRLLGDSAGRFLLSLRALVFAFSRISGSRSNTVCCIQRGAR
jgi:hypothetical protein